MARHCGPNFLEYMYIHIFTVVTLGIIPVTVKLRSPYVFVVGRETISQTTAAYYLVMSCQVDVPVPVTRAVLCSRANSSCLMFLAF